jgi:calcium/calmodulin-dependent protein kinase I
MTLMQTCDQWLTTHAPSTEHDISVGLRDNFSPRKKWQSAVYKLRAASRLNSGGMALRVREATRSGSIGGSGGWGDLISDDEDISNEGQEVISPSQDELHPPRQSLSPTVSVLTSI